MRFSLRSFMLFVIALAIWTAHRSEVNRSKTKAETSAAGEHWMLFASTTGMTFQARPGKELTVNQKNLNLRLREINGSTVILESRFGTPPWVNTQPWKKVEADLEFTHMGKPYGFARVYSGHRTVYVLRITEVKGEQIEYGYAVNIRGPGGYVP